MKRSLIALMLVISIAVVLGTLVAKDPGYVLIAYGDQSIQTGLWVFLALLLTMVTAGFYL